MASVALRLRCRNSVTDAFFRILVLLTIYNSYYYTQHHSCISSELSYTATKFPRLGRRQFNSILHIYLNMRNMIILLYSLESCRRTLQKVLEYIFTFRKEFSQ